MSDTPKSFEEWFRNDYQKVREEYYGQTISKDVYIFARAAWHARDAEVDSLKAEKQQLFEALNLVPEGYPVVQSMLKYRDRMNAAESQIDGLRKLMEELATALKKNLDARVCVDPACMCQSDIRKLLARATELLREKEDGNNE